MLSIFKKRWVWIVALFLVINVVGLLKIISLTEREESITSYLNKKIKQVFHIEKKPAMGIPYRKPVKKDFVVENMYPRMDAGSPYVKIRFSQDVDLGKAKGYIVLTPEIPFHIEKSYSGINVYATFKPGAKYKVEVLKSMPSDVGVALKDAFSKEMIAPDYASKLKFKVPGMYMSLKGNCTIPVEVMNLDKIEVRIHKVYENNIVYLLNYKTSYSVPHDIGLDVYEKEIDTNIERNVARNVLLDMRDILKKDPRGLFFIRVKEPNGYYWGGDSKLVLTTDIGIIAKKSGSDLLVWLNSLTTTNPIANTTVKVFTKTNQQTLQGTTDENGIIHFKDINWSGDKKPYVITASNDYDLSYIELDKCVISETAFDVSGRPYISSGYEGFIYTDRGVYRPGEKVHIKAILREAGWKLPESFPVILEINRPDGRPYKKVNAMLSEFGAVDASIDILDYALTGGYTIKLMLPGDDKVIGSAKFNVEEFLPDRLKVIIDVEDKRFTILDEIPVVIKAEQFFGGGASDKDVELSCDLKPAEFKPKDFRDYVFTDEENKFSFKTIRFGEQKTDKDGKANFTIKIPEGVLPPSAIDCSMQAVVKEVGGRAVTSNIKRTIDPYSYYIGIRKASEGSASSGEPVKFDYVIVSPQGKKIDTPELKVEVSKIAWNSVLKKDENDRYRYTSEKKEEIIFNDTISSGNSSGRYEYTPKSYGDYIIRIKTNEKNTHVAGIKFYCSGYGYTPWAMEKPDKVELSLDKKFYKEGDVAKLLIKSPFKGKAIIIVSKDKLLSTQTIELTDMTQEVAININSDFSPNAYCSVTVIQPLVKSEEWVAHRAYGIIPITVDNAAHKLNVSIDSLQKAKPNDDVKINIEVKDSAGNGKEAELSIAIVDEGILQLTGFKMPDPFEFFYGKRANSISSYDIYSLLLPDFEQKKIGADSSPSADMLKKADFDPKKHLNPISAKRVKPFALWKGSLVTDSAGKASATFKIPQFTGNVRVMAVVSSGSDFGNSKSDMKVAEPLMIEPTIPRFLASNDEFILPVSIFNKTGANGEVIISLKVSDGFNMLDAPEQKMHVGKDEEAIVKFKLKAPDVPQKGKIEIHASLGDYATSRTTEIAIRPTAPFTSISGSGSITAPNDAVFQLPSNWLKGTQNYSLVVMALPGLKFAGGLKYLAQYPYGCIEQTTSCVYPLLYLGDITAAADSNKYSPAMIDSHVNDGIQKVLSMQTYSGGFAMWPGYKNPYKWGSIYATDFLVEADKAGYAVPQRDKNKAINYLKKLLGKKETSLDLKAYICFVLSKAGKVKQSWIRRVQEKKDELSASSKFYLAASLASLGDRKAVSDILGQGLPDGNIERETGGSLRSYTKENAIVLSMYMDLEPENALVPVLVKRLESSMVDGNWQTTQDNAAALVALGKYARYLDDMKYSNYSGSIIAGKETIADFDNEHKAEISGLDLSNKDIKISVQGEGVAYYYWNAEGVPLEAKVAEEDKGIKVRRKLFTRDGSAVELDKIKHGDVVVVEMLIKADVAYSNVLVEDLLPACFEIENPRLASTEKVEWMKNDSFEPDHVDIRDDRLLLFTDLPGTDVLHYRYAVRAVTKGEFTLPPISASCMYDPTIVSVNGQGKVKVSE